jgi:hypothetical protein
MAEIAAFRTVQIGKESTYGTAVAATIILPVDVGSGEFSLNRAHELPDEDFGSIDSYMAGRGSYGVRIATGSVTLQNSFELLPYFLQMAGGTPVTSGTASPYTHTFTFESTSATAKSYTWEVDAGTQDWIASGVVVTRFDIGFDAVGAGQNAMWTLNADLQANDLATGTATGSLSAPSPIQTMEGHLSQLYEGPAGTAFASLSELSSSLVSYRLSVECPKPLLPYGGTADTATTLGRGKRTATVSGLAVVSASTISDFFDIYNVSGALPTDRRMRIKVNGSNSCSLTIDHRVEYDDIHIEPAGRDGERLVAFSAKVPYDSTLASSLQFAVNNATSSY